MGLKNYLKNGDAVFDLLAGAGLAGAAGVGSLAFNALSPVDVDPAVAMALGGLGGAIAGGSYRRRLAGEKPKGVSITGGKNGEYMDWLPESMTGDIQVIGGLDPNHGGGSRISRPVAPIPEPIPNVPTRVTNIPQASIDRSSYSNPPETGGYSDSDFRGSRPSINASDAGMGASGWGYAEEDYSPVAGFPQTYSRRIGHYPTATL